MSGPANPAKGEAKLGGFTLLFDFNALCSLEAATGRPASELFASLAPGPNGEDPTVSFSLFRTLIWAGLQAHHPDMSEAAAGNLIQSAGGPQEAANALAGAFTAMAPTGGAGARPPKAAGGTGKPSSSPGQKKA